MENWPKAIELRRQPHPLARQADKIRRSMDESEMNLSDDLFAIDGEATRPHRQVMAYDQLLACVTALMQSCEGCEKVSVVGVTPLDRPDTNGCNWSFTLVLDTAGVAAEVYGFAYAQVIGMARGSWNLA